MKQRNNVDCRKRNALAKHIGSNVKIRGIEEKDGKLWHNRQGGNTGKKHPHRRHRRKSNTQVVENHSLRTRAGGWQHPGEKHFGLIGRPIPTQAGRFSDNCLSEPLSKWSCLHSSRVTSQMMSE